MFELLNEIKETYVMQLPHSRDAGALAFWKEQIMAFRRKLEALAVKYLNINCSVMSPNQSRLDYIAEMIEEYAVDGVIEIVLQSCHTYDIEAYYVKRMVTRERGIPYLNIETDYSQSDKGQIGTRLAGLAARHGVREPVMLTGGLYECDYLIRLLEVKLGKPVKSHPMGRYAGAMGAALIARDGKKVG